MLLVDESATVNKICTNTYVHGQHVMLPIPVRSVHTALFCYFARKAQTDEKAIR